MPFDPITIISRAPRNAGETCFMPVGNCHTVVFRPDNIVQGIPNNFCIAFDNSINFNLGDTIVVTTADGNTYSFVFMNTPTSAYELSIGATISDSLANIADALVSIPYFHQHYQHIPNTNPSICAIYVGADYILNISGYDANSVPLAGFTAVSPATTNLQLLQNYCINVDIYEIDPNCEEWANNILAPDQIRKKRVLVDTLCGKPVPDYIICDNEAVPSYQFKVTLNLHSELEKLFTKQLPPRCNTDLNIYSINELWRRLYFEYYSCRVDASGFSNPQSVINGYYFNVSHSNFLPLSDWESDMEKYCGFQKPLTERPRHSPILSCLNTCQFVTFWSNVESQAGVWAMLHFSDGSVFPYITNGFDVSVGFYGYNFTIQMLYNLANIQNGGILPPIEALVLVRVKTTPLHNGFADLQYAYDHQLCCKLCTTTLIYKNNLGAFEGLAVQCAQDEYTWAVETYCNIRNCADETVNDHSLYGDVPNYMAAAGKWVSSKELERSFTINTLPNMVMGSTDTYKMESLMVSIISKSKDHWLLIDGIPHKFILKTTDFEYGKRCWTFKGSLSASYNII